MLLLRSIVAKIAKNCYFVLSLKRPWVGM